MREKKSSVHTWGGSIIALKDAVDFRGPVFFKFFFHVGLNIIILTIDSKKTFGKILKRARVIYKNVFWKRILYPAKCE